MSSPPCGSVEVDVVESGAVDAVVESGSVVASTVVDDDPPGSTLVDGGEVPVDSSPPHAVTRTSIATSDPATFTTPVKLTLNHRTVVDLRHPDFPQRATDDLGRTLRDVAALDQDACRLCKLIGGDAERCVVREMLECVVPDLCRNDR